MMAGDLFFFSGSTAKLANARVALVFPQRPDKSGASEGDFLAVAGITD